MAPGDERSRPGGALTRVALDGTPLLGRRTGVGRYVGELVRRLPRHDLDVRLTAFTWRTGGRPDLGVPWRHRPAPARLLRAAWLRAGWPTGELLSGRVEVFHGTNFVLPPLRRAAGVVTVHDLTFLRYPEAVAAASLAYRDLVPAAVRRAARVLTPSQAVAAEVAAEYGLPAERVVATPLGVDPAWASAAPPAPAERARLGLPERYVLFVGTREPRKDLRTLVDAHRAAGAGVPPLVLVGPAGWGAAADLPPDVVLPGWLPEEDLRSTVAGADVVVLPSRYEGFGLPVLEALACGRPVVCSDLPVLREVGGDLCRYAAVGDVDAFAQALLDVGADPGDPAPRRARAEAFTWQRCAALTVEAYRVAAQR